MIPSIWNLPSIEDVWKKQFSKSRPGFILDTSHATPGACRSPGRDTICVHHWPFDCRC